MILFSFAGKELLMFSTEFLQKGPETRKIIEASSTPLMTTMAKTYCRRAVAAAPHKPWIWNRPSADGKSTKLSPEGLHPAPLKPTPCTAPPARFRSSRSRIRRPADSSEGKEHILFYEEFLFCSVRVLEIIMIVMQIILY